MVIRRPTIMTLIIHHLQASQSERIVWLAEELGLDYQLVIHKRDPFLSPQSIKDLNPLGQAPVIQDGSLTLPESSAIAEYILTLHNPHSLLRPPPSHPSYPQYLYWFHFANGNLHPQLSRSMLLHHCGIAPSSSFHAQRHFAQTAKFLKFVDDSLSDGRRWLAGEEFTAADIMCVFPLTTMRAFSGVDLSEYGNILAWLGRCVQREGYQRYREKADPELELMVDGKPPANFLEKLKAEGKL